MRWWPPDEFKIKFNKIDEPTTQSVAGKINLNFFLVILPCQLRLLHLRLRLPVRAVSRVQPHSILWPGMFKLRTFSGLKDVMGTVEFITFISLNPINYRMVIPDDCNGIILILCNFVARLRQ